MRWQEETYLSIASPEKSGQEGKEVNAKNTSKVQEVKYVVTVTLG